MDLAGLVFAAMVTWVPLAEHSWYEKRSATEARYHAVAEDVAQVVLAEEPVFDGEHGRERTALLLAAIASLESGYHRDVDHCVRRGPGGAETLWQLHTPERVCRDRLNAVHVALRMVRESFADCRKLGLEDRLGIYTTGRCVPSPSSRHRVHRAEAFWRLFTLSGIEVHEENRAARATESAPEG